MAGQVSARQPALAFEPQEVRAPHAGEQRHERQPRRLVDHAIEVYSQPSGAIDGEWTLAFTRPGQNGRVQFTGVAGDELYLGADNVTIGSSTCCGLTVSVRKPNGTTLNATSFGTNGGSLTLTALPTNGTYTLFVDPGGTSTGSITLSLPRAKPIPGLLLIKWYSFDDANCTDDNFVDPVNAIFYGDDDANFISTTQNHVNHHTGW